MDFIDLEEIGRYLKQCRQRIQQLTDKAKQSERAIADRDAQIRELQSVLVRERCISWPADDACRTRHHHPC